MKREERNKIQRERRAQDTPTRQAMIRWNKSEKAKLSTKRYLSSEKGREFIKRKISKQNDWPGCARKVTLESAHRRTARWDAEEIRTMFMLRESGKSNKEIAIKLQRSLQGVERKLQKLGYSRGGVGGY